MLLALGDPAPAPQAPAAAAVSRPQPASGQWLAARAAAAATPLARTPGLSEQIDTLLASNKPADAFSAYKIARLCHQYALYKDGFMYVDQDGVESEAVNELKKAECKGLTHRQIASRIDHLETAFRAGVPDAAVEMLFEGPFGDPSALTTRPDDPLVVAWKKDVTAMLHRHAASQHPHSTLVMALELKSSLSKIGQDRTQALAYALARRDLLPFVDTYQTVSFENWFVGEIGKGMSPQEIAAAKILADRLVQNWKRNNGR